MVQQSSIFYIQDLIQKENGKELRDTIFQKKSTLATKSTDIDTFDQQKIKSKNKILKCHNFEIVLKSFLSNQSSLSYYFLLLKSF